MRGIEYKLVLDEMHRPVTFGDYNFIESGLGGGFLRTLHHAGGKVEHELVWAQATHGERKREDGEWVWVPDTWRVNVFDLHHGWKIHELDAFFGAVELDAAGATYTGGKKRAPGRLTLRADLCATDPVRRAKAMAHVMSHDLTAHTLALDADIVEDLDDLCARYMREYASAWYASDS